MLSRRSSRSTLTTGFLFFLAHRHSWKGKKQMKRAFVNINMFFSLIKQDGKATTNKQDKNRLFRFFVRYRLVSQAKRSQQQLRAERAKKKHFIGWCWHKNAAWILNDINFPVVVDEFLKKMWINTNTTMQQMPACLESWEPREVVQINMLRIWLLLRA